MHEVRKRVDELAEAFEERAEEADALGRLPDDTAAQLRAAGVIRMLQPRDYGGYESDPMEFFDAVMTVGAHSASAGWVCGVVGVHPFEIAQMHRRVQDEIWAEDPDTWVASPYAPLGRARPVDGGYVFSGRWPFSSGTDHCQWIVLGGMVTDQQGDVGGPDAFRHFVLPRQDYEILHDSWQVVGLKGSGSKDVVIQDAFVPEYRVIDPSDLRDGQAAQRSGRADVALYRMPFHVMFAAAITAGTLGIAEGALAAFVAYTRNRQSVRGGRTSQDPHQLSTLGAAAADIEASRQHFLSDVERMYEVVQAGDRIGVEQKITVRRNQVRASRRAVEAVDALFAHAGGGALRLDNPIQRYWRDVHAAMNHIVNVADPMYQLYGASLFGNPLPPDLRL
jgi:3-hydroxy-9,10-secoandrosta-1,3,5(10)-triene-9,17-dione monooxygenase